MILSVTRASATLRPFRPRCLLPISFRRPVNFLVRWRAMASVASTTAGGVERKTAPYGSWKSPITADVVSGADKKLGGIGVAGDGRLMWVETRPEEGGRAVLVKESENSGDKPIDVIPSEFAARTLAQEYGGGAFSVFDNVVIFSNYKDQRLYKQIIGGGSPVPLTPDFGGSLVRFADGVYDPYLKLYLTVMEDHRKSSLNPATTIVSVNVDDETIQDPKEVVSGNDFYAFPRIDSTGRKMAWLEWSHPNMPWDKAQLWVGYFSEDGKLQERVCVAGCNPAVIESPSEPRWSPKGELFFVSDRNNGFWNIYKWNEYKDEVIPVYSLEAEFTRPLWVFGISSYDFLGDEERHSIVCSYRLNGRSYLGILNDVDGSYSALDTPFTDVGNVVVGSNCLFIEGASASHAVSVVKITLDSNNKQVPLFSVIWSSSTDAAKYKSYFSLPEIVKFPTGTGEDAYAYFYSPSNPDYQAPVDEKPPLIVKSHGGPTSETRGILDLNIQYWTSRGWAFVDVNYGGSTGYGREYRERLLGQWGVVDVNDCCQCARFLVEEGKVDKKRLCITGRSAGGYTTLACLAFTETFKAGASLYGVADLSLLREETHKFESHYIDRLVGDEKAYFERSPINFVDKFTCPVILFQGLDDKIVLPDQAQKIYKALKEKGLPVALVEYEGEQHGFRKAENIKFTLEQQMLFFARTVGHFKVADPIVPIKIDNFD
ncbi:uncharacterized protein LOC110115629 [Dendrobium catenatum]|uniref:uncharacterized protein LOC110115629 n=1 Tax=Dendrobium catenatum TaxID=906689 RepID=UPI0009F32388|nr:uncharacterized protein LOC110115629 [Dendrobium catenatum]XP_020704587.1 uncharacterized protein LOC110115629 [Dendrobium catenatum]